MSRWSHLFHQGDKDAFYDVRRVRFDPREIPEEEPPGLVSVNPQAKSNSIIFEGYFGPTGTHSRRRRAFQTIAPRLYNSLDPDTYSSIRDRLFGPNLTFFKLIYYTYGRTTCEENMPLYTYEGLWGSYNSAILICCDRYKERWLWKLCEDIKNHLGRERVGSTVEFLFSTEEDDMYFLPYYTTPSSFKGQNKSIYVRIAAAPTTPDGQDGPMYVMDDIIDFIKTSPNFKAGPQDIIDKKRRDLWDNYESDSDSELEEVNRPNETFVRVKHFNFVMKDGTECVLEESDAQLDRIRDASNETRPKSVLGSVLREYQFGP